MGHYCYIYIKWFSYDLQVKTWHSWPTFLFITKSLHRVNREPGKNMNKLIVPFLFIACLFATSCIDDDEPRDKTKDIIMSVSEETDIMYDLFDDKGEYPIECMRVMDEDFPGKWRNLSMTAIEGFDYEPGHRYTLKVRRTILANPPADASSYTYRLLEILEDRIWPEAPKEDNKIIVKEEADIPYEDKCPYHIYDLYKDAFVIDKDGKMHYANYKDGDIVLDLSYAAIRLVYAVETSSPDFIEFNRTGKKATSAYVLSPLTDKIERVSLTRGTLYIKDIISQDLFDEIVTKYESGKTLEYALILANSRHYGLQKVYFTISKE